MNNQQNIIFYENTNDYNKTLYIYLSLLFFLMKFINILKSQLSEIKAKLTSELFIIVNYNTV